MFFTSANNRRRLFLNNPKQQLTYFSRLKEQYLLYLVLTFPLHFIGWSQRCRSVACFFQNDETTTKFMWSPLKQLQNGLETTPLFRF